jgi:hypothetical protein
MKGVAKYGASAQPHLPISRRTPAPTPIYERSSEIYLQQSLSVPANRLSQVKKYVPDKFEILIPRTEANECQEGRDSEAN